MFSLVFRYCGYILWFVLRSELIFAGYMILGPIFTTKLKVKYFSLIIRQPEFRSGTSEALIFFDELITVDLLHLRANTVERFQKKVISHALKVYSEKKL